MRSRFAVSIRRHYSLRAYVPLIPRRASACSSVSQVSTPKMHGMPISSAAFQSAGRALAGAVAIQKALAKRNSSAKEPVRVRMGLHAGEVVKEGEDFFGRNVIMAARVAGQAEGGEILVSGTLKALVESAGDITWGEPRRVELKGLSGIHEIWPVAWSP